MYKTDFTKIINFCVKYNIEFEINKRFVHEDRIELVFYINQNYSDIVSDRQRVVYNIIVKNDETDKVIATLEKYLNINPM